ncbi:unnamed protein product [Urochloa humidicola]
MDSRRGTAGSARRGAGGEAGMPYAAAAVPYVEPLAVVPYAAAVPLVSDSFLLDSIDEMPDSIYELPDSVDKVPDSIDEMPDFGEEVLDVDAVVDCPRCKTFHVGGAFGEACRQARRNARRCAHCGLLHEDYDGAARVLHGMDNFDCKFYIPVVQELQLDGETIILPEQIVQKLDEMDAARKMERPTEKVQQAKLKEENSKGDY